MEKNNKLPQADSTALEYISANETIFEDYQAWLADNNETASESSALEYLKELEKTDEDFMEEELQSLIEETVSYKRILSEQERERTLVEIKNCNSIKELKYRAMEALGYFREQFENISEDEPEGLETMSELSEVVSAYYTVVEIRSGQLAKHNK